MKIIDMHVHVGQFDLLRDDIQGLLIKKPLEEGAHMPTLFSEPKALENYLRANGVLRAVVLAECGPGTNFTIDSAMIARFAKNNPFYIPFGTINPHYHNVAEELENSIKLGMCGFKLYPADYNFDPQQKEILQVYKECEERHLPIMFHTGLTAQRDANENYIKPEDFEFIAKDYPELNLILAHAGKPHWYDDAIRMLSSYENVYVDTALVSPEDVKYLADSNSKVLDKILFGSDWPVAGSYTKLINSYLEADIAPEVLEKIMYNNVNNFLNKVLEQQKELEYV